MTAAEQMRAKLRLKAYGDVTALANALKISRAHLSNVIHGNRELTIKMALLLERECGLDARKLLMTQLDEQIEAVRQGGSK